MSAEFLVRSLGLSVLKAPTFSEGLATLQVVKAPWMFAVDDGAGGLVLSAATRGELWIGRVAAPLDAGSYPPTWMVVVPTGVTDMWHVFAFGVHWLSYFDDSSSSLSIVGLDTGFNLLFGPVVVADGTGLGLFDGTGWALNDHFLVASRRRYGQVGVSMQQGRDTRIVWFTEASATGKTYVSVVTLEGPANGASARAGLVDDGRRWIDGVQVCSGSLGDIGVAPLLRHTFAASGGAPLDVETLLSTADTRYSMPTSVYFGMELITYRRSDSTTPAGSGYIGRRWFSGIGAYSEQLVYTGSDGVRPHTLRWDTHDADGHPRVYVVTCWCAGGASWIRIDEVTA